MKVLAVAPQPFFTPRGTPFSVYHRCSAALEAGFEVDLLTYGEGIDPDLPGLGLYRIPSVPGLRKIPIGPSFTKLALDGVLFPWFVARLLRGRYDVVWAHEEAVFFARFLKPIFRYRLIYDMHSSLPQQLENFEFSSSRALKGVFSWLEHQALRHSDAVLTISPALADYALSVMPHPERHILLENTLVDPVRLIASEEEPAAAIDAIPATDKLVLYAGTFEPYQGLELLLEAFEQVRSELPEAHLLIVGGEREQVEDLRERARRLDLASSVTIQPRVLPAIADRLLERASVVVSPRTQGTNTPLKLYSYLARGCALVATRVPSHTQILDETVCWLAEPNPRGLATAIRESLTEPELRKQRGEAALDLYRTRYSREQYLEKLHRLADLLEH